MKHLIIGPGSMIIYHFLGSMKCLYDTGKLEDLQEISCSSTGSILGLMYLVTRGNFEKMLEISMDAPLSDIAKPDLKTLMNRFGLISTDRFERFISKKCVEIMGKDPTFSELYEFNPIKIHIPTFNIITDRTIYMSVDTTPDMKVSHAVRRSISVPFIMSPYWKDGGIYVDGSLCEKSPFVPFIGKQDVIEIRYNPIPTPKKIPRTLFQYFYVVISSMLINRSDYTEFKRVNISTDIDMFNFSMSSEDKLICYRDGYSQCNI